MSRCFKLQIFQGQHCAKSIQIRRFFWSVFSRIRTEYGEKKLRIWILFSQCKLCHCQVFARLMVDGPGLVFTSSLARLENILFKTHISSFFNRNLVIRCLTRDTTVDSITEQKLMFSIKDFFSKSDQIRSSLQTWLHLLKKSLMENFIFCVVCESMN